MWPVYERVLERSFVPRIADAAALRRMLDRI
jgi:hypothetical protein